MKIKYSLLQSYIIPFWLLVFMLSAFSGKAQWQPQQSGTNNDLQAVHFPNNDTGCVVGNNGTLLYTNDGGNNWNTQPTPTTENLLDIYFINDTLGWAVGNNATILHSTDGGLTWNSQSTSSTEHLRAVEFINDSIGWIVGANGTVLRTDDGGQNWNLQVSPASNTVLTDVHFVNANVGWITGYSSDVYRTTDGGDSWETQSTPSLTSVLWDMHFEDASTAWAVGNGSAIVHTTDGGDTWEQQVTSTGVSNDLRAVHFNNKNKGWTAGFNGSGNGGILTTKDGGSGVTSWETEDASNDYLGMHFAGKTTGWAVGDFGAIMEYCPTSSHISPTVCESYTVPSGHETYYESGVYQDTLTNADNCDSIIVIDLTVKEAPEADVSLSGNTLYTNQNGSYQWLNCNNNYAPVSGETSASFVASTNGEYALELTRNGCKDTSNCISVTNTGIVQNDFGKTFNVYPNPASENVTVDLGEVYHDVKISVTGMNGKERIVQNYDQKRRVQLKLQGASGLRILTIKTASGNTARVRLMKE